jgi:DNA modification methylase
VEGLRVRVELLHGDCVELMRALPECSVDSIVTDPPYGLEFMGKQWDRLDGDAWRTGGGFSKPGIGDRETPWVSYGAGDTANPTCATCGGRKRGKNRCSCEHPEWRVKGKALEAAGVDSRQAQGRKMQGWHEAWAREALRVLKPGGHLLAFGGTRTYHRMACAIEDAGFEIRDSIHWVYGSGFPKSLNVGKAIDKRGGSIPWQSEFAEHLRAVKPKDVTAAEINAHVATNGSKSNFWGHFIDVTSQPLLPTVEQYRRLRELLPIDPVWDEQFLPEAEREVVGKSKWSNSAAHFVPGEDHTKRVNLDVTAPATDEAARWEGWGTALKPAHEPVVVARKPLSGTVAGNVLVWGTGGLNIDGCRVGTDGGARRGPDDIGDDAATNDVYGKGLGLANAAPRVEGMGRWPANIVLDGAAAAALDQQSEGAARYFTQADFGPDDWPFVYQAKPSKRERNAGLDGLPARFAPTMGNGIGGKEHDPDTATPKQNTHPTVKPVALMRHLVRLVTPPGGTVLDPFAGSGTTLVAAVLEGFDAIGCEMTDEYLPIIEGRVAWAEEQRDSEQPRLL